MATMSVSGIVSGMDWESMIDELITNAAKPAQVKVNKKTNLTNKKSLFEEMKVTMNSLQSSLSALKLPSTYKAKTVDIERLDKNTSYKGVLTATANADAEVNVWEVEVKQLATAQINRSKSITDSSLTSTLNGVSGSTMYIEAGGQKIGVEVKSTDTLQSLKSRINTTLKTLDSPIYVTASVVDNKLILKSDYTGLGTMTAKETFNYNYSGTNKLNNISIPSEAVDEVKITSSGKSYVIHKDFEIANGNEVRWKRYDRGTEVALNDDLSVKYTMTGGDVYEKSGKVDDGEANISEFNIRKTDEGILASRLKIQEKDDDGNVTYTYYYGKDFTLDSSGNVKWLEKSTETTNEPSSYTVSYDKTVSNSFNVSNTRQSASSAPDSYTVQYTDELVPSTSLTYGRSDGSSFVKISVGSLTKFTDMAALDGVSTTQTSALDFNYLTFDDDSELTVNINGTDYVYGRDYVIRKGQSTDEMFLVPYWNGSRGISDYLNVTGKTMPEGIQLSPQADIIAKNAGTLGYTHVTSISSTNQTAISNLLNDSSTDLSDVAVLKSDGTEYTENTDYHITNGEIVWTLPNDFTDLTTAQFAELQTKYAEATGSELSTVTLIDGDGVLRTYVDPDDPSILTMSANGVDYEYGRDYVLRVNDAGTGYRFDWLIEDSDTITDANTTVATYAAYKDISTQNWKAAPDVGKDYSFGFDYEVKTSASGSVNKTSTDKSLSTVLNGTTIAEADYSLLTIDDGKGTTYNYGIDFKINDEGNIEWLDADAYAVSYKLGNTASRSASATMEKTSGFTDVVLASLNNLGVGTFEHSKTADSTVYNYVDVGYGKAAFTLTDDDGKTYEYGKDYFVRCSALNRSTLQVVAPNNGIWPTDKATAGGSLPLGTSFTITYNNPVEAYSADAADGAALSEVLGFTPSDVSKLTVTGALGKTYTYNSTTNADDIGDDEFAIIGGVVTFATKDTPKKPTGEYTLVYESLSTTGQASDTDVSIKVNSGYGDINEDTLSYEQVLKYVDIAPTSDTPQDKIDESLKGFFTLVGNDGKTYEYGKDYRIIEGTEDSSGKHTTGIEWITGGSQPSSYTLYLSGNETIETKVTRSNYDTLSVDFADIEDGTVTITQGTETYYEGVDFELTEDEDGKAVVNWIPDSEGGYEWYYPDPSSTYRLNFTDDNGNTMTYTGRRSNSDTLDMSDKFNLTTANGSISVQYGDGVSYNLNSDATYTVNDIDYDVASMVRNAYSVDVNKYGNTFDFRWLTPSQTTHSNLPSMNEELTLEYSYDANTFDLSDDGDGDLLKALGFLNSSGEYDDYTEAKNAILLVDGQEMERDANDIGEDYENELIKGVTLHLKGLGTVSLDISHDAEKAVESIQTFVDTYNDLMTWMNTRMTEKEVDKDTAATIDSDDFRMRWGLLHGNSLLRNTKSQMRSLVSQNFTFSFTERKSTEEIYGPMSFNGLKTTSTLRLRIGSKYVDVTIDPTDTLQTIVDKINDDTKNGPMHNIYYDDDGNKLATPLLKASVENDILVINSTSNDEITMSGSAAMNALKMNYTYRGLYQIGIETTSDDYGKSGELVFDANEFMEALADNPDEVQSLMLAFANDFNTWTRSMLNSSSSGEVSGTLTREIENIQSQIDSINEYLEDYQDRLDRMEENLRTRYANTETQFSKLSQQANSIAAILNQLNGTASGGGYGQTSS